MNLKSFIICTYNRAVFLEETIISVVGLIGGRSDCEILVIDNNSADHTKDVGLKYGASVRYFLEEEQGLSSARNRGIKEAKGDLLLFIDDDVDLERSYLDRIEAAFKDESVSIVGGKVLPFNIEIPGWLPKKYYYLASVFDVGNDFKQVPMLMGANYAMRKTVASKVGLYNVNLGRKGNNLMGGEESDYFNRANAFGFYLTYDPELIVYHKIEPKLNKNYIYTYSIQCGISEHYIDSRSHKAKFILKSFKSILMLFLFKLYGKWKISEAHYNTLYIGYLYALGYLKLKTL